MGDSKEEMPPRSREDTGNRKPAAARKRETETLVVAERMIQAATGFIQGNSRATKPKNPEANLIPDRKEIRKKLTGLIKNDRKGLQKFYGETEAKLNENLKGPIERGENMARKLIEEEECSREIAKDLTVLTLYDVAILIDDSDSMIYAENGERKKTLISFINHITKIYLMANERGILAMRFINCYWGKKNWKDMLPQTYLDGDDYGGLTRIGSALKEKILDDPMINNHNKTKPLLVLIVTDGAVQGERKGRLKNVIRDYMDGCESTNKGLDAVTFQFSRIGNDPGAAELLEDLDNNPAVGKYIDVLPVEFDPKNQLEDRWFVLPKILLGAILPDWDREDDHRRVDVPSYPRSPEYLDAEDNWWNESSLALKERFLDRSLSE